MITAAISGAATIAFVLLSCFYHRASSGGTVPGIVFGVIGYGLMVYAFLLWARKKYPTSNPRLKKSFLRRVNRGAVEKWMKGHLWLGLLSYVFILYHAGGFHFGSGLTFILMWSFTFVVLSGLLVAGLQHFIPRFMTISLPMESIYNDIGAVRYALLEEANHLLAPFSEQGRRDSAPVPTRGATAVAVTALVSEAEADKLWNAYQAKIKPYLLARIAFRMDLGSSRAAEDVFARLRLGMPERIRPVIDELEEICREKRDLDRQTVLQWLLHIWLLVHIPLASLVIVLGVIHAIASLHYLS